MESMPGLSDAARAPDKVLRSARSCPLGQYWLLGISTLFNVGEVVLEVCSSEAMPISLTL